MRTTVDIPDGIFKKMKAVASIQGVSIKSYIVRALTTELKKSSHKRKGGRVAFPLVKSSSPGTRRLTGDEIAGLLNGEDINVSS